MSVEAGVSVITGCPLGETGLAVSSEQVSSKCLYPLLHFSYYAIREKDAGCSSDFNQSVFMSCNHEVKH